MDGQVIMIQRSDELVRLGLEPLIGWRGVMTSFSWPRLGGKKPNGVWVWFEKPYLDEHEWFIPFASIML